MNSFKSIFIVGNISFNSGIPCQQFKQKIIYNQSLIRRYVSGICFGNRKYPVFTSSLRKL